MQRSKKPYIELGKRLSEIRKSLKETLPEVSGAVELDADIIQSYEKGETRPSEEVLGMLISHFEVKGEEADELWELAGYVDTVDSTTDAPNMVDMPPVMPTVVVVPMDGKIVYTDKVNISVNNNGMVMNFMQESVSGQAVAVSRVGMSVSHAKKMLEVMQKTIDKFEEHKPKPKNNN